ncbi:MAG: ABC transporter permease [Lachnospiraceae bacterium]
MKIFWNYLLLEYKKSMKVLPKTFGSTLLMLFFMLTGIGLVSFFAFQSHIFAKVNVAMVIPEEEKQVQMIMQIAETMESVESICDFVYVDQTEAMEQLKQGKVVAAIILPDDFYEDVNTGYNTPLTVYVSANASINQQIFQELLTDGVSLLRTAESGVYSMLHGARIYSAEMTQGEIGDYIAEVYMMEAFRRNDIFEESIYSSLGNVNLHQYYFAVALNLILMMFGMNFGFLYRYRDRAVEEQLKVAGIGRMRIAWIKIGIMSTLLWIVSLVVYLGGIFLSKTVKWNILFWEPKALLLLFLLCLSVAVYLHLLYSLGGKSGHGAFLVFAVNAFMILCSGGIIPAVYLPKAAAVLGKFLPLCLWNQYITEIFFINGSRETVVSLLGLTVVMMVMGAIASWKNT